MEAVELEVRVEVEVVVEVVVGWVVESWRTGGGSLENSWGGCVARAVGGGGLVGPLKHQNPRR